jgi:hypothetical protein
MHDRSSMIKTIRPTIISAKFDENTSCEERFQNATLRPIIKLQNLLLIEVFRYYILKHKNKYYELSLEKKMIYIENAIQKDIRFRNSIKGLIVGHFTIEEYQVYKENASTLNKRMMSMIVNRLKDQMQLLENDCLVY